VTGRGHPEEPYEAIPSLFSLEGLVWPRPSQSDQERKGKGKGVISGSIRTNFV